MMIKLRQSISDSLTSAGNSAYDCQLSELFGSGDCGHLGLIIDKQQSQSDLHFLHSPIAPSPILIIRQLHAHVRMLPSPRHNSEWNASEFVQVRRKRRLLPQNALVVLGLQVSWQHNENRRLCHDVWYRRKITLRRATLNRFWKSTDPPKQNPELHVELVGKLP